MEQKKKNLILIVGPTAVGKTDLSIAIAKKINAEIFSCDSRQFYKEISIGTAKPTTEELAKVRHHFVDNLSIKEDYTVSDFEQDALAQLDTYFKENDTAIMTGGSGLFVKAITHGFDNIPDTPKEVRQKLIERIENGEFSTLVEELSKLDPEYSASADLSNKQRITRALEVCIDTNIPYSSWLKNTQKKRPFQIIKIGLERPREELYNRINLRVELMLKAGLLNEVRSLEEYRHKNALQTVGYKEVFQHLDGEIDYENMVELIKRNSRRYAKRQLTWFKNKDEFRWFEATKKQAIINFCEKEIK
ncbi:MAG: tRNA dimethylallyltransferase [Arcticibacterium sp.]|jgi:tRNA dimethylallyltransferase